MNLLNLIGREKKFFTTDLSLYEKQIIEYISKSKILIIGGAGSIGQAVTKEVFKRNPKTLHVVDLSENNLVELVREIRSTFGYITGEFKTFAIDVGSFEFDALMNSEKSYDYIFNLSALKHVRSEKDPFTLMRLIQVNILNTLKILRLSKESSTKKLFCVSTDKATNPVNMMGASKRIMEMFLFRERVAQDVTMARFANVAFSDGSLLYGFNQRFFKRQPFSAPYDVKRYFITPEESGELCLMACLLGSDRDIFFPKLNKELNLITFSEIAIRYLRDKGYAPYECKTEDEARQKFEYLFENKKWPCFFFKSDTSGEKAFEEFYSSDQILDMNSFESIGIIKNQIELDDSKLDNFIFEIEKLKKKLNWTKEEIVNLFNSLLSDFNHIETGKDLDQKM